MLRTIHEGASWCMSFSVSQSPSPSQIYLKHYLLPCQKSHVRLWNCIPFPRRKFDDRFQLQGSFPTNSSMQRACPIPDPDPHSASETDDLRDKGAFSRFFIKCWRSIVRFFSRKKPNPNKSPQEIMDAVRRRFGISVYDLVGAIIGVSGDGKSTLTNRLCNCTDVSPHAAPIGVVECTTEPSVYYDPACPRFKIMDNPRLGYTRPRC